jgi:hypothetical protein
MDNLRLNPAKRVDAADPDRVSLPVSAGAAQLEPDEREPCVR